MIEENNYNSEGSLDGKETYKYDYDKQGNWVKRIGFDGSTESITEREYEYYQ